MRYHFPHIGNLRDIRGAIADRPEFITVDKGAYIVVDYVYTAEDTFGDANTLTGILRRECRGLVFDRDGILRSRPYHKFFNLNERPETQQGSINVYQHHHILEKLDGSMIRPLLIEGGWRLATRMGVTAVAMQAETYLAGSGLSSEYTRVFETCRQRGMTPIFEWCSPANQIVVKYTEERLVLAAVRHTYTGAYLDYNQMYSLLRECNAVAIPIVQSFGSLTESLSGFVTKARQQEDMEGYVIRFSDGHMLKIKNDWYVQIHKTKDVLSSPRDVVGLIVENRLDDVIALLPPADQDEIKTMARDVQTSIDARVKELKAALRKERRRTKKDRKTFATEYAQEYAGIMKSWLFACWDDTIPPEDVILRDIKKAAMSRSVWKQYASEIFKGVQYRGENV